MIFCSGTVRSAAAGSTGSATGSTTAAEISIAMATAASAGAPGSKPALGRHAAGREQEGVGAARVVRLAAEHELQDDGQPAGDRDRAERAGPGVAQRPDQPGDPERRQGQAGEQDLGWPVRRPVVPSLGLQGAEHGQVRPAVRGLPGQVGHCQDAPRGRSRGHVAAAQEAARVGREETGSERGGQERDVPFGLAGDARARRRWRPTSADPELTSSLVTSSSVSAQKRKSGTVVVSSCIAPMYSPQVAAASAASSWPVRPAPSSLLIAAVITTSAASPSAGHDPQADQGVAGQLRGDLAISGVRAG